jgi:preprotein translocase subunit SecD
MGDHSRKVFGLIAAGLLIGCGTSHRATLRIAGEGGIGPVLSRADVRAARVEVDPVTSQPYVDLVLTTSGQKRFLALATGVAQAGRRRHRLGHLLISVNGTVISKPTVEYHGPPNSLPFKGVLVDVASIRRAHDLARRLNR